MIEHSAPGAVATVTDALPPRDTGERTDVNRTVGTTTVDVGRLVVVTVRIGEAGIEANGAASSGVDTGDEHAATTRDAPNRSASRINESEPTSPLKVCLTGVLLSSSTGPSPGNLLARGPTTG